jgi:multisubunit Na+/H+ antiporter MnhB subunit
LLVLGIFGVLVIASAIVLVVLLFKRKKAKNKREIKSTTASSSSMTLSSIMTSTEPVKRERNVSMSSAGPLCSTVITAAQNNYLPTESVHDKCNLTESIL